MKEDLKNFLEEQKWFLYKNYRDYLPELENQVSSGLGKHNINQIHFPHQWSAGRKPVPQNFLVMDLGGMYLRLYLCQINAKGKLTVSDQYKKPFYEDKIYTPEIFFADLKRHLDLFSHDLTSLPRTLIFSFGNALHPHFRKNGVLDGKILYWGKNHQQRGMIELELGQELEKFLGQRGYPGQTVYVINDSSLALLSTAFAAKPLPIINLVAGSGTNISVGYDTVHGFKLFNLEFGNFDFFPYCSLDDRLNHKSRIPNKFRTEKLFAGAWQHHLFRIVLEKAVINGVIPDQKAFAQFETMSAGQLEEFFHQKKTISHFPELRDLWTAITERGAFVCAQAVYSIIVNLKNNHLAKEKVIVSEIGAMLEHSVFFRKTFEKELKNLVCQTANLEGVRIKTTLIDKTICPGAQKLLELCGK